MSHDPHIAEDAVLKWGTHPSMHIRTDPVLLMSQIICSSLQQCASRIGDVGVCAGLKTFASVQSTRQLSQHTSAGLGVTWQPRVGLGLQLVSSRELSDTTSADFNWVVGPAGAAGAGISVSRRGEKFTTSGRIEVRAGACQRSGQFFGAALWGIVLWQYAIHILRYVSSARDHGPFALWLMCCFRGPHYTHCSFYHRGLKPIICSTCVCQPFDLGGLCPTLTLV